MSDGIPTRDVTLREMVTLLAYMKDADVFRWHQTSYVTSDGSIQAGETLRVTMGQARNELNIETARQV